MYYEGLHTVNLSVSVHTLIVQILRMVRLLRAHFTVNVNLASDATNIFTPLASNPCEDYSMRPLPPIANCCSGRDLIAY